MCEYCGCQDVPAIAQLTSEHDDIRAVGRDAARAGRTGDHPAAVVAAKRLLELLEPHTAVEERGLFPATLSVLSPQQWDALDDVRAEVRLVCTR
jgi:hemerythrin-like domain-containing protein